MMILRSMMAAVRKGSSGALERVPSAGTRNKPVGAPLRAIHPNSSPVYKTQSETAITAGLSKLTINDNKNRPLQKRVLSGKASSNGLVKNVADAAGRLQMEAVKNVVIVAGAGISTPSGIPDFRSPGTGLYDNLQQYNIPYPEAIFDIDYFFLNPRPFFTLAKELYPSGKYRPNYIHYFVKLLYDKGLLLRMYTQNIDGLERLAGVPAEKLVEAHGTFATATCTTCRQKMEGYEIKEKIFTDKLPRCPTRGCVGIVKPDIVFFGEDLPRKFYSYMKDMLQADLVLVMGTSLEVQPFAGIIDTVRFNVPRILFNREAVGPFKYQKRTQDVVVTGDLIDNMVKFATQVGWKEDMVQLITKQEGQFTILNKSPPTQTNQTKVNNYTRGPVRGRPTFTLYDTDSSSTESSESDSDVTSSDSSEEENKKGRFRGLNRGKLLNNNNLRNGANRNNGVRSTSAKLGDTNNKRDLHTQRNIKSGKFSPAGSLTGRSVKSESAINATLAKRKLDNAKNVTSTSDNRTNTKVENDSQQSKKDIPPVIEKQKVQQAERERVLKKYGLGSQPVLNNLTKITKHSVDASVSNDGAITPVEKNVVTDNGVKMPVERKEKPLKTVKSDSVIACSGYFVEDLGLKESVKNNAEEVNGKAVSDVSVGGCKKQFEESIKIAEMDAYISNEIETFRKQRNAKHIESLEPSIKAEESEQIKVHEQNSWTRDTPTESKTPHAFDSRNKDLELCSEKEIMIKDIASKKDKTSKDKDLQLLDNTDKDAELEPENPKVVEHNKWKKESSARDKVLQLLDRKVKGPVEIDSCTSSAASRNENKNDKGSKMLSEKAAKSFTKYAKLASHKKGGKKHSKKHRISQKDRPPPGARQSPGAKSLLGKTQLKSINSRPYGYAHRQANVVKGVGPFHRTNKRTLNSAIEQCPSNMTPRSGSADLPKISYRHQIQPTPTYDTRSFGMRDNLMVCPDVGNNIPEESR
ncbi:uncharacterized protein LOC128550372 isoform X2 [Mercenaria mercenaria]|uniref:uncharacterized protein LOC128550372 isoform X2 n=1 Tax=Mercenaria mercenaria TaxID=6596 RepID=UPI00234F24C1|nr:uncharacterized protein LOC128550372 isoform X2 [Mercenaria mercenaria]